MKTLALVATAVLAVLASGASSQDVTNDPAMHGHRTDEGQV
jgi:hypothetical protein